VRGLGWLRVPFGLEQHDVDDLAEPRLVQQSSEPTPLARNKIKPPALVPARTGGAGQIDCIQRLSLELVITLRPEFTLPWTG
jgi:hypothetical protein